MLFWPRVELARLVRRWPVLAKQYGQTWDRHRTRVERELTLLARSGYANLAVSPGSAEGLAGYAHQHGGDPTDPGVREEYAQHLGEHPRQIPWPPGRNEECWCGSGSRYKRCCLPRSRS